MAPLLPSEVARLVYGQLKLCSCLNIAHRFLEESPHLGECREFVKKSGKLSFMTKAYGLTLQEILERYLDMWNLILDQTNNVIPNSQDKFADPVDALEFLLSTYDKSTSQRENMFPVSSDVPIDNDASSSFSLRLNSSAVTLRRTHNELLHRNHSRDLLDCDAVHQKSLNDDVEINCMLPKLKKRGRYLDELYASTESLENPSKKKKLKVLKPRSFLDKSVMSQSLFQNPAIDAVELPIKITDTPGKSDTKDVEGGSSSVTGSSTEFFDVYRSKGTNMQLRSSRKWAPTSNCEVNLRNSKVSKKRKCPCSPERVLGCTKPSKMNKFTIGKENDAQVDFTKIPQLLIDDPKWPELIAENINKTILESPQKMDTLVEDKDNMIQSIAEKTLEDDLTAEFIRGLLSCAQTINQDKNSGTTNISLLDDSPYDANLNWENDATINDVSESADITKKPSQGCSDDGSLDYGNSNYINMNEFVRFNNSKGDGVISDGQSDIIVIGVAETEHISSQSRNTYVIEDENPSLHSSFVVCSSQEPYSSKANGLKDEIFAVDSSSNNVKWNVQTSQCVIPIAPANTNKKLQICGPVMSPSKVAKRLRLIAPKPDVPILAATHEKSSPNKSKSFKKSRK